MADLKLQLTDEEDKLEFEILQRYLLENTPVEDAAGEITALFPTQKEDPRSGAMDHFGSFLAEFLEQIPYEHPAQDRLVQLIQQLSTSQDAGVKIALDHFSMYLRERFDPFSVNQSAFFARLEQSGFLKQPTFAIWTLRKALEEANDLEASGDLLSSAALYIIFAKQAIYSKVVESPPMHEDGQIFRSGPLYQGPEMGLKRWTFWKEALLAGAQKREAGEECVRLAKKAADMMDVKEKV